jgi:hypothetical protein
MELPRKLGIGIVMIVPTFVFAGLVYNWFHSYIFVFAIMIMMAVLFGLVFTGKIFEGRSERAEPHGGGH